MQTQIAIQTLQKIPSNQPVAIDYETAILAGPGSVEYYRHDFRALSLSISINQNGTYLSFFISGEDNIRKVLEAVQNRPVITHNLMFEYGVTKARFPDLTINWAEDTMRLTQCADNGNVIGIDDDLSIDEELESELLGEGDKPKGLSLNNAIKRWLPKEHHGHKELVYKWLADNHPESKRKPGSFLHLLPEPMLIEYNCKDAELTLRLYYVFKEYFAEIGYDHSFDHYIYIEMCKMTANSKIRGVYVDKVFLTNSINTLVARLSELNTKFRDVAGQALLAVEEDNKNQYINSYKSERGKEAAKLRLEQEPELYRFNTNSVKQKQSLFCDKLGMKAKILTAKGAPSFKKSALGQWGDAGKVLQDRGTALIAMKQAENLVKKSEYDSLWHIDLSPAGTTTGRMKGGGGLNIQAMSRREELLMRGIVARPGHIFISRDLKAGEPSVIAHFSGDEHYRAAILDMVGKAPYYKVTDTMLNDILMIDDIYLMGMSVSPLGRQKLRQVYENERFNGKTFAEQWVIDPEVITKGILKKDRQLHKILILGVGYEMGPRKMVASAAENGFNIKESEAKAFIKAWWSLMADVNKLRKRYQDIVKAKKSFVNFFGYRLVPEWDYKAMNYMIQSSVNGLINLLCIKHFTICPEDRFVTIIHDEIISEVPIEYLEKSKACFKQALDSLNEDIQWNIKIQAGHAQGKDFYESK